MIRVYDDAGNVIEWKHIRSQINATVISPMSMML